MTTREGRASASGHVTLLFSVQADSPDPLMQGSRGAGLCVDAEQSACEVVARATPGSGVVTASGDFADSRLHTSVVDELSTIVPQVGEFDWSFEQRCGLPIQQGFGLSAAGSLSIAMATQRALGLGEEESRRRSFHVAHVVERHLSGGLGDVAALWVGGVDLRREPGCPELGNGLGGTGVAEGWSMDLELVLAWRTHAARHTSSYIDDPEWRVRITQSGERLLDPLRGGDWNHTRWGELLAASRDFAIESGLSMDAHRAELLELTQSATGMSASCHLCMLGESVAIVPIALDTPLSSVAIDDIRRKLGERGLQTVVAKLTSNTLR